MTASAATRRRSGSRPSPAREPAPAISSAPACRSARRAGSTTASPSTATSRTPASGSRPPRRPTRDEPYWRITPHALRPAPHAARRRRTVGCLAVRVRSVRLAPYASRLAPHASRRRRTVGCLAVRVRSVRLRAQTFTRNAALSYRPVSCRWGARRACRPHPQRRDRGPACVSRDPADCQRSMARLAPPSGPGRLRRDRASGRRRKPRAESRKPAREAGRPRFGRRRDVSASREPAARRASHGRGNGAACWSS
jgi:hypothetical protein